MTTRNTFRQVEVLLTLLALAIVGLPAAPGPVTGFRPGDFPDLLAPVRIVWDDSQAPHVYAHNDHDAYFAMGYLHARDRLFQMDYNRRLFSGTLAELVGQSGLDSDIQFRTLGLRRAAERSWEVYSQQARTLFDAYSSGVNAYIREAGVELPAEYQSLELTDVEPWTSLDSVTISNGVAFGLSFDLLDIGLTEAHDAFVEAGVNQGFDGEALFSQDLDRSAPFEPAVTIPSGQSSMRTGVAGTGVPGATRRVSPELLKRYSRKIRSVPILRSALERTAATAGSNFWIIDPAHSATGHALFANDPHLSLDMPAVFYEIQLSVSADPANGPMQVTGVSFPGTLGVVQGCNDRICWGSTVNPMDVTDIYQEQLVFHIDGSFRVTVDGTVFEDQVEPVVKIPQDFRVNHVGDGIEDNLEPAPVGPLEGGVTYIVPRRNNGPIVQVIRNPDNLFDLKGLSIQYAGWGATRVGETFVHVARARNFAEFRDALQYFDFGSQNWGYADIEGNIAYFTSGELPIREDLQAEMVDGAPPWFVRDGTGQSHNEWLAVEHPQPLQALEFEILPFGEMPQVVNPAQGFIASANNDPIGVSLDNDVLNQFRPGGGILYLNPGFTSLRIGRIDQMIRQRLDSGSGRLTLEDLRTMQADNQLLDAQIFVPYILAASGRAGQPGADSGLAALGQDAGVTEAVQRLAEWDFTTPTGIRDGYDPGDDPGALPEPSQSSVDHSVAATIYSVWRGRIVHNTIDAALNRVGLTAYRPDGERSLSALRHLLDHFGVNQGVGESGLNFFGAAGTSDPNDARDILILRSLREALDALASTDYQAAFANSVDQDDYRWGILHRIRFDHPLGGSYDLPPAGGFSDLSPSLQGVARSGGYETVDASSHSVRASGIDGFMFGSGPARRFVAELAPGGFQAFQVIPGGRSEAETDPSFVSEMGLWLTNHYHPLWLTPSQVEGHQAAEDRLTPPAYRLYFPMLQGDAAKFTGFAVANIDGPRAELEFRGWSDDGTLLGLSDNPHLQDLSVGAQLARVASEVFGTSPAEPQVGWVELVARLVAEPTEWPVLGSLTQLGDFQLHALDGASAVVMPSRELYFTMLDPQAENLLSLVNPGDEAATVQLHLVLGPSGDAKPEASIETIQGSIPAHGVWAASAASLFSTPIDSTGYVRATTDQGMGLVGTGRIQDAQAQRLVVLNALSAGGTQTSYSAQLALGEGLESRLNLINTGDLARQIGVSVIRGAEEPELDSAPITLQPGEFRQISASELFSGATLPPGGFLVGSLIVRADGPGVIGSIVFGDPDGARFGAALPLQGTPFRKAVFGHVANLGEFFTGLALFNAAPTEANLRIRVFDPQGELQGEAVRVLGPWERLSQPLSDLVPSVGEMAGGYIVIDSDQSLVGQEIFGTSDLRLQSAVPPTLLK